MCREGKSLSVCSMNALIIMNLLSLGLANLFQRVLWLSSLDFISKDMSNLTEPSFISLSAVFLQTKLIN